MLGPAPAAAAAAAWLLVVLSPGLSLSAEHASDPGSSLCRGCFYRQTPPQAAPAGPPLLLLQPLCHRLPGGRAFATASKPTCDTTVYSAFHLGPEWTEREGQEEGELVAEQEEGSDAAVPALLRGAAAPSEPGSPSDLLLQLWDSTVTTLVRSIFRPYCSSLGGDLYILTGRGRLGAHEDGDKCQTEPLWCAVCCAVPEGTTGFSVGFIREAAEGEKQVSVRELEEELGGAELFSEGCLGAGGASEEPAAAADLLKGATNTIRQGDDGEEVEVDSGARSSGSSEASHSGEPEGAVADAAAGADVAPAASADAATSEGDEQQEVMQSGEASSADESAAEPEADGESSSVLVFVLSTTASILTAPLRPVFSTVTRLPGQVTYVLQEDLGVLSAVPGDTFSLLYLLTSDLFSWIGTAADTLLGFGKSCFDNVYHCSSSMGGALLDSCYAGVMGVGTLTGDAVGIFGDGLGNCWWVTKFFGGRVWDQSGGYVGTVMSEMGGQAKALGGGLGRLVWRSGNGVGNIFGLGGGLILGVIDVAIGGVREAFGQEAET